MYRPVAKGKPLEPPARQRKTVNVIRTFLAFGQDRKQHYLSGVDTLV